MRGDPTTRRRRAQWALLLLVPAPTIGTVCAMLVPGLAGTPLGHGIYAASKLWILLLPLWWWLVISRHEPRRPLPPESRRRGIVVGAALGVVMSLAIVLAYLLVGRHVIDIEAFREAARTSGLADPIRYVLLAVYICTVNALIEEIVWRWFVFRRGEEMLGAGHGGVAVALSALFFTIHHIFALAAQLGLVATIMGSIGVFIGGVIWSWCYLRFRSIAPGYVSHAIVDVAIFAIGWLMLFGAP